MARMTILGSGSRGNSIIIDNEGRKLLVECGVPYSEIMKGLNYDISNVTACVSTHRHLDHLLSINNLIKKSIPCYSNQDVCDNYKGCNVLPKVLMLDGYKIQHFELDHNAPNTAFVVDLDNGVRVLYVTDTKSVSKRVKSVNFAIVECNHDFDTIIDNLVNDDASRSHPENHLSLDACIDYLKEIYSPALQGVVLWHLSDTNIDAKKALERVKEELGFDRVWIAEKGLEIELEKEEF